MVSVIFSSLAQSSLSAFSNPTYAFLLKPNRNFSQRFSYPPLPCSPFRRRHSSICFDSSKEDSGANFPGKVWFLSFKIDSFVMNYKTHKNLKQRLGEVQRFCFQSFFPLHFLDNQTGEND